MNAYQHLVSVRYPQTHPNTGVLIGRRQLVPGKAPGGGPPCLGGPPGELRPCMGPPRPLPGVGPSRFAPLRCGGMYRPGFWPTMANTTQVTIQFSKFLECDRANCPTISKHVGPHVRMKATFVTKYRNA